MTVEARQNADTGDAPGRLLLSAETARAIEQVDGVALNEVRALSADFARFMMPYKFGIDEVSTKISILSEEFSQLHDYNPIEHVTSRLKSQESVVQKVSRRGLEPSFDAIRASVTDIAGVRVVCSFVSDVYRIAELLSGQADVRVREVKDYIAHPKPNGYKSLHLIVEVPVFLSSGPVPVTVEVQFRTIAMDFWASLEHKIYYKYDREVPQHLLDGLRDAAQTAAKLDTTMEGLHTEIRGADHGRTVRRTLGALPIASEAGTSAASGLIDPEPDETLDA